MRKALIAASALTLALTVGACGDDKKEASPTGGTNTGQTGEQGGVFNDAQSLIDAAKEGTAQAKTSKFTMDMRLGSMLSMKAEGSAEYAGENTKMAMNMTMDMSGMPGAAGNQGELSMEMVLIDQTMYMKLPEGLGGDADKPWMKMSIDEMGAAGGQFKQSMEFSDPAATLAMIQENGKILSTEQTTVDGAPATKYSVELDAKKLFEKMGQGQSMPAGVNIDSLPMDVYLNAENLPVQIEMDLGQLMKDVAEQTGQPLPEGMENGKMTAKYTNWGEPVDVQAPPPDQVSEQSIPGMGSGSTPTTPN